MDVAVGAYTIELYSLLTAKFQILTQFLSSADMEAHPVFMACLMSFCEARETGNITLPFKAGLVFALPALSS